jgi:choline dehydrogenase-like flavoprotein
VASRLSVDLPDQCILVIEAGPAAWDEEKINIPGRKGSTLGGPYDWNFTTVAQPDAQGRTFNINRGKVLGGSSALNLMTWDRGAKADYDAWEELGNEGWNWGNFIKAMEAVETFKPDPRFNRPSTASSRLTRKALSRLLRALVSLRTRSLSTVTQSVS